MESEDITTPEPDEQSVEADAAEALSENDDNRPRMVYLALLAGAATLLILLAIVWFASRGDNSGPILCLDVDVADSQQLIFSGDVTRADILLDTDDPMDTLTAIQLELEDGDCLKLPEGADNRDGLYQVLGYLTMYNEEGPGGIKIVRQKRDIPLPLLQTSTSTPTETPIPTATMTPVPTETAAPPTITPTQSPSPALIPTMAPAEEATPVVASPAAAGTPAAASPEASPSPVASAER